MGILINLMLLGAWAYAEPAPKCDPLLQNINYNDRLKFYQEAPSTELKIQILQMFPDLIPDSRNQIRIFALKSILLELESKRSDFLGETTIALRALSEVGLTKDVMLLDQVIRSEKPKATHAAMITKERLLARIENRPANIEGVVRNSPLVQKIVSIFQSSTFTTKDVDIRLRVLEPFLVGEEKDFVIKYMLEIARSEIQFIIYGLENDSYSFTHVEKKFPSYVFLEFIADFGEEADVKLLEKFITLTGPKVDLPFEEIQFRDYHLQKAGVAAVDLRSRLKMGYRDYSQSNQGD
jgi:hypothetical protein